MQFQSRVTQKGQVTIPKKMRDRLRIRPHTTVRFHFNEKINAVIITTVRDFAELAEMFGPPPKHRGVDPVRAREYMEKHYERR